MVRTHYVYEWHAHVDRNGLGAKKPPHMITDLRCAVAGTSQDAIMTKKRKS